MPHARAGSLALHQACVIEAVGVLAAVSGCMRRLTSIETVSFRFLDDTPLAIYQLVPRFDAALGLCQERLHDLCVGAVTHVSFRSELSALFAQLLAWQSLS
jgi:hypothetical protein